MKDGVIEQKENKDSTVLKLDTVNTREYEFLQFDIWIQYQLLVEHKSGDPSSNTTFCFSTKLTDSKNNNHEKQ